MAYGSTACTISISRQRNDSNVIPQKYPIIRAVQQF